MRTDEEEGICLFRRFAPARAPRRSVVAVADVLLTFDLGTPPRLQITEPSEGERQIPLSFKSQRPEHRPRFGSRVSPRKTFLFYRIIH